MATIEDRLSVAAAMFHACPNAAIQWLLDSMTIETSRAARFAGEVGVALAASSVLFAIYSR